MLLDTLIIIPALIEHDNTVGATDRSVSQDAWTQLCNTRLKDFIWFNLSQTCTNYLYIESFKLPQKVHSIYYFQTITMFV